MQAKFLKFSLSFSPCSYLFDLYRKLAFIGQWRWTFGQNFFSRVLFNVIANPHLTQVVVIILAKRMELLRLDTNIFGKCILVFVFFLGQFKFERLDFLDRWTEISFEDLGLFANAGFVESLDDGKVACAVFVPLVFLEIVWSGYFGPVGVQLVFEFRGKWSLVVRESHKTIGIVALIFYAVEVIQVLTGGLETSDGPFVAVLAKKIRWQDVFPVGFAVLMVITVLSWPVQHNHGVIVSVRTAF
jgi:hypothetical protein